MFTAWSLFLFLVCACHTLLKSVILFYILENLRYILFT
nr:MAG TPA: hypothetical protein [Caudoviricetes sp.]